MEKKTVISFALTAALLLIFASFTAAVCLVDVKPIGPLGSSVGFASLNGEVFRQLGENPPFQTVTDALAVTSVAVALGFAAIGAVQLIKRKSLLKVDHNILLLGAFYVLVAAVYIFFELVVINYRPVAADGVLEASYPSSHTMAVLCISITAIMNVSRCVNDRAAATVIKILLGLVSAFAIVGRMLAGIHWFTDIIGSVLVSAALASLYRSFLLYFDGRAGKEKT